MSIRQTIRAGVRAARVARGVRQLGRATDEDARARARQNLCRVFAAAGGVPAKVGQLLGLLGRGDEFEALGDGVEPLPYDIAARLVEERLGAPVDGLFSEFSPQGHGASFGQVHQARTADGRAVAVKLRYPGIEDALRGEFGLLRVVPSLGPLRRASFDMDRLRATLESDLLRELDYGREARDQAEYGAACAVPGLVVPRVLPELCADGVLTQSWEDGVDLATVAADWPKLDRARVAETLIRHFLRRLFVDGRVHADPHSGNYRFRQSGGDRPEVVLLDYGSIADLSRDQRLGLLRLMIASRDYESVDPIECFARMGFDERKLEPIAHLLPALARILFEPLCVDSMLSFAEWQPGRRIRAMLGESAWWFRSAAPPSLLLVLRAFAGLLRQLEALDVRSAWRRSFDLECAAELVPASKIQLQPADASASTCSAIARTLVVRCVVDGEEKVALSMPARAVDDLENLIEPEVLERLNARGIDLEGRVREIRERGYPRCAVFEEAEGRREISVILR